MHKKILSVVGGFALAALLGGVLTGFVQSAPAEAASASAFDPSRIIDDAIFFNGSLMSEASVQAFLQRKVPTCTAAAGNSGCLKDYRSDSAARAANNYCAAYPGGTNQLASTIIYNVALACNINAQVLLVTLQKEENLVLSTNPSAGAYKIAMGYGCPDTAACDTTYYGFANQVYAAAKQFEIYRLLPFGNFRAGRTSAVSYYPAVLNAYGDNRGNARCGTITLTVQNAATAALYNYTPYAPNAPALGNLYGQGDTCSSYGNRNFWTYFTDWFGSTTISSTAISFVKALYSDVLNRAPWDQEIAGWGQNLMNGMSPVQIGSGFVNSDEYRLIRINAAYRDILGRTASPQEATGWLNNMRVGIIQTDDVDRTFLASQEFFGLTGGTNELFVSALYSRLIGRPAAPPEASGWGAIAASSGRQGVVNSIWNSFETARSRVAGMYSLYLGRTPVGDELDGWAMMSIGGGDSAVRWSIMGSAEYMARAVARFPAS